MSETSSTSTVTLRIKKIYLEQIRSGEKKFEYRSMSAFNMRLLEKNPTLMLLHYQNPQDKLLVKITKIEIVDVTPELKATGLLSTDRIFKIHVERINEVKTIRRKKSNIDTHGFLQ